MNEKIELPQRRQVGWSTHGAHQIDEVKLEARGRLDAEHSDEVNAGLQRGGQAIVNERHEARTARVAKEQHAIS